MADLGWNGVAADWWPFLFILVAGWLPTDIWRFLGVLSAGRLDEHSPIAAVSRTVATALVSAVIGQLVFYPTGALGELPFWVRLGGLGGGFLAYALSGRRLIVGVLAAEGLILGWIALGAS